MSSSFLIKHRSGGKFIHPKGGSRNSDNNTPIVLHSDIHKNMYWTFERVVDHWGYIKHVSSGKIIHPLGGRLSPGNDTELVLHSDRQWGALFALDATHDHVIHKGGRYAHPYTGNPNPRNETHVVLHSDVHDAMRFQFVSTSDPSMEVLVYGKPTLVGKWKIINMVRNPLAEHMDTIQVKIGRSETESRKTSFQYSWELSSGFDNELLKFSASQSDKLMMERTSSTTWSTETTRTRQIRVSTGDTVVTWQFVFDVQQNLSRAVFQSNLLADTNSEKTTPGDVQYAL